jgi:pimeloyl-ACP methyl ester carboxylesterase
MRLVYACVLAFVVACGRNPGASVAEPQASAESAGRQATPRFEPTAFSVQVHGHGRPVILIPGLGCPSSVWNGTVDHLHQLHGYQTHVLTLAGFAGKPRIERPLLETTVDELARYIRDRRLVAPVIIGHSLGGFVAFWLAAREPGLVGPTVVVDAGAGDGADDAAAAAQARDQWRDASDEEFAQRVKGVFGQMAVKRDRLEPVIAEVARSDRRAIGDAVYELSVTTVRDQLGKIRAPVLLVLADGGLKDSFRRQAEGVPHREVAVIPNTGHFVMLDDPEAFFSRIDDFLTRHERLASNRAD